MGEHVLEANKNPNWICPIYRGICNCSLCRQEKGWAPTGALYKKIAGLGYKPVVHYLIQTHRATISTKSSSALVFAKGSLLFSDTKGRMVMTTQTEVKPVEYDAKESNYLALECKKEPLLKYIVEPLLLQKHYFETSGM
ncbi:hypothetical protein P3S68_011248 [Capsicum galapagoense]